ncbi:unnamed protein product [Penicillium nalgiovense]|nr:unnamed protein product [Penicillium nalgiovense]
MEASENLLGHRTNTLALQRLQCYQGYAIIKLQHLRYEEYNLTGTREIAEKNVEKLFRMFEIEGCGNLEPEHRVAATINQEVLRKALTKSNLTPEALIDPKNQPNLLLEGEDIITYVYGKHRLKAGERLRETTWLVDLYLNDISIDALAQLREESTQSISFTIGEIYRTLRSYQISQNPA